MEVEEVEMQRAGRRWMGGGWEVDGRWGVGWEVVWNAVCSWFGGGLERGRQETTVGD